MARTKQIQPVSEIKRVLTYARYSAEGGRENITTLITQKAEMVAHCELMGWEIVKEFVDVAKSAFKEDVTRPDFDRAIEYLESDMADAIVVWKIDRFVRTLAEFGPTYNRIKAAGKKFVAIKEPFDTSSPVGESILYVMVGLAQQESQTKSDRSIPMHKFHQSKGLVPGGQRPYGYARTNSVRGSGGKLTIISKERDLLQTAADWICEGKTLHSFISTYQPESTNANKQLTIRGLKLALTNATTAGLRRDDESKDGSGFTKGCWDAILPREQWEQLRAILNDPDRKVTPQTARTYLLSGLMQCGECHSACHARNWTNKRTKQQSRRYMCGKCLRSVDMQVADDFVMNALWENVPQSLWQTWQLSGRGWDESIIEEIQSRRIAVDRQFSTGKIDESRWVTMSGDLDEQLFAATNNEPLDIPMVDNLAESWEGFSLRDKQRVMRMAFKQIDLLAFTSIGVERIAIS